MEARRPPEYTIDLLVDRSNAKDLVKALLHTIFFHRYFPPTAPSTHEILDLTLPYLPVSEITSLVDARVTPTTQTYILQFLERKRKKSTWFSTKSGSDDQVWENWVINVQVGNGRVGERECRRELRRAVMRVLEIVGSERAHIPPITTNETNPFPFQILVKGESGKEGWGKGIGGIF